MEENNNLLSNSHGIFGTQNKYVIRKTGEEVEVIDSYQEERGARSMRDWVTYIDSNGEEHIRQELNLSLDFKPSDGLSKKFEELLNMPSFKLPFDWATKKYELVKMLYIERGEDLDVAIEKARNLIDALKKEPEFHDGQE